MAPKMEGGNLGKNWEILALGSLGAHVSHKAAQVAQGNSKWRSVYLSIRLSVCPSVCLSVRLSVCLSVCVSVNGA